MVLYRSFTHRHDVLVGILYNDVPVGNLGMLIHGFRKTGVRPLAGGIESCFDGFFQRRKEAAAVVVPIGNHVEQRNREAQ